MHYLCPVLGLDEIKAEELPHLLYIIVCKAMGLNWPVAKFRLDSNVLVWLVLVLNGALLNYGLMIASYPLVSSLSMNNQYGEDKDEATVMGFEVPRSPDSSYNNVYPGNEDEARDPPVVPPHLHRTLLRYPASVNTSGNLPLPENVILNHLYIENREPPRSVVALGFTQRFRAKYVTVVLYKPVPRRGSSNT
ncbi:hypothetical protein Gorai_015387 [Gossypium raimondii]|uniref:Association with the SNF1 complex (ASC) domain-containing protein n=3 Tax=Gossypium raimondii TaxID=29730 RepID=A0A7J8P6N5_GOSRA|nr:hypothetical protein [Gossypium raimondii]